MRVCHFEDALIADLEPLTLTRAAFELLCGCTSLADKQARHLALTHDLRPGQIDRGALVRPLLAATLAEQSPAWHVNDLAWLRAGAVVLVNGRWLPPAPSPEARMTAAAPYLGVVDGEIAYAVLPPEFLCDCSPLTLAGCLEEWKNSLPSVPVGGWLVRHLWELVEHNGSEITLDSWLSAPEQPRRGTELPTLVGPADRLFVHPSARIDPLVVADTTGGSVIIDRDVVITAFTRLEGPCYIGPGTQLLGARIRAGTSFGPQCRIGGEVENSIVQGWSNKYHDGFLGHAYVGEWVNLGAGTSNSDLRNDYGEVRVTVNGKLVNTGRSKVGCFIGDHTKTGLGALLNTGTNAGVFCNLLPTAGLLPKFVPSFASVWNGVLRENSDLDLLLKTADKVIRRRGRTLTEARKRLYRTLWDTTALVRSRTLPAAETPRLRQTA